MLTSFVLFFVCYFLVVFVAILGFFWQDARFFWLAWINLLSLVVFFVISFVLKKQENKTKSTSEEIKQEKIRYPHQFVKYPYMKHQKKWKTILWYLLFVSLFLFLFSVIDLTIFHILWQLIWIFPLMYLLLLLVAGKDLIENKIKIFWIIFNFYFFLFISSLIVGVLVYWTLIFNILPIILLSALLVSFLFFFVWYIFIKNQWLRFFFRLIYSKIYFIAILFILIRSILVIPTKHTIWEATTIVISDVWSFFKSIINREKPNKDPLLYTWEGQVINSWTVDVSVNDYIFEETWQVVVSWVNPVFTADEEVEIITWALDQKDTIEILKEELGIKNTDSISMLDSLRFLMEVNKITLSTSTNTKFTYVSKTNPLYSYWKTAYDNRMIWASTNPSTKITCETYQVFKGMLLKWDLKYSSANVKNVFWAEAKKQDVLNWCVYGKLLKGENL